MTGILIFVAVSVLVTIVALGGERVRGSLLALGALLFMLLYRVGQASAALGLLVGVVYIVVRVVRLAWGSP